MDGKGSDTLLIMRSLRNTERVFNNASAREVLDIEKKTPGDFKAIAHLVAGDNYRCVTLRLVGVVGYALTPHESVRLW